MIKLLFVLLFISCTVQKTVDCEYISTLCYDPNEDGQVVCEFVFECKEL